MRARAGGPVRLFDAVRVVRPRGSQYRTRPAPPSFPSIPPLTRPAQGQPPLAIQRPTTAQLENLEERLASSGAAFREQAKDLVVALDRSPDLDLRFLAVRLNFNYQFRECERSACLSCALTRVVEQDRIRRARGRRCRRVKDASLHRARSLCYTELMRFDCRPLLAWRRDWSVCSADYRLGRLPSQIVACCFTPSRGGNHPTRSLVNNSTVPSTAIRGSAISLGKMRKCSRRTLGFEN